MFAISIWGITARFWFHFDVRLYLGWSSLTHIVWVGGRSHEHQGGSGWLENHWVLSRQLLILKITSLRFGDMWYYTPKIVKAALNSQPAFFRWKTTFRSRLSIFKVYACLWYLSSSGDWYIMVRPFIIRVCVRIYIYIILYNYIYIYILYQCCTSIFGMMIPLYFSVLALAGEG